jgi:hypothetical protein
MTECVFILNFGNNQPLFWLAMGMLIAVFFLYFLNLWRDFKEKARKAGE